MTHTRTLNTQFEDNTHTRTLDTQFEDSHTCTRMTHTHTHTRTLDTQLHTHTHTYTNVRTCTRKRTCAHLSDSRPQLLACNTVATQIPRRRLKCRGDSIYLGDSNAVATQLCGSSLTAMSKTCPFGWCCCKRFLNLNFAVGRK